MTLIDSKCSALAAGFVSHHSTANKLRGNLSISIDTKKDTLFRKAGNLG